MAPPAMRPCLGYSPAESQLLQLGQPDCCPKPPGFQSLGPQQWCHCTHDILRWYTPFLPPHFDSFNTIGNGIAISYHGTSTLLTTNTTFHLNNVLVAPLVQLTTTHAPLNLMPWVFVNDLQTGCVILCCNSGRVSTPRQHFGIIISVIMVLIPLPPYRACMPSPTTVSVSCLSSW